MMQKINRATVNLMLKVQEFKKEERGDTNFLSIAIILIVVLGLAIMFITFGDTLKAGLTEAINNLKQALNIPQAS